MTSGVPAFATFLIWNYRKVLEITNISGPSQSRDTIDLTSHDSSDSFKEYVAGLIDGGSISIEGNFIKGDAAGQVAFHTDMQAGTKRSCFIVMPMAVGGAWSFEAIASGFEGSYPYESKIGVTGSLKITGKPTLLTTQSAGMTALAGIEENGPDDALVITPTRAVGTYAYVCEVDTTSTHVEVTVTAGSHTVYIQGELEATGVQSAEIALGDTGTTTDILIIVYETAEAARLYTLTVTRPSP